MTHIVHRVFVFLLRPPVYNWHPRGSWLARLRRWCWHVLLRYECETCDRCGGRVRFAWLAESADLWRSVYKEATGEDRGNRGLLCEDCFSTVARRMGTPILWWASKLNDDHGDRVAVAFPYGEGFCPLCGGVGCEVCGDGTVYIGESKGVEVPHL